MHADPRSGLIRLIPVSYEHNTVQHIRASSLCAGTILIHPQRYSYPCSRGTRYCTAVSSYMLVYSKMNIVESAVVVHEQSAWVCRMMNH